jgi:hypothetical protein
LPVPRRYARYAWQDWRGPLPEVREAERPWGKARSGGHSCQAAPAQSSMSWSTWRRVGGGLAEGGIKEIFRGPKIDAGIGSRGIGRPPTPGQSESATILPAAATMALR